MGHNPLRQNVSRYESSRRPASLEQGQNLCSAFGLRGLAVLALVYATALAAFPDTAITVPAQYSGCVVLTHWIEPESRYYSLDTGEMQYGWWVNFVPPQEIYWCSYLGFDLAAIPDTAGITGASLSYYQYYDTFAQTEVLPRLLVVRDWNAESVYAAIGRGERAGPGHETQRGWNESRLDSVGLRAIQGGLASDSVCFALVSSGGITLGYAYGCDAPDSLRPRLQVGYAPCAVSYPGNTVSTPRLSILPNPVQGMARISWSGLRLTGLSVRVCDAAGRFALDGRVDSQGRIDLSGLAAGTYTVVVRAGTVCATRQLVKAR